MQAVLLATGEGTNIRPITDHIPAPMLPLANRPVIAYAIELLARHGIKDIVISLYHLPEWIEGYLGSGRRWGVNLSYVLEREALGSAGALWRARVSLQENFLVMPVDTLYDLDLAAAVRKHLARMAAGTVLVAPEAKNRAGQYQLGRHQQIIAMDSDRVAGFPWCGIGIYIFNRQVLNLIPPRTRFDISNDLIPRLLDAKCPLFAVHLDGISLPLGSPSAYQEAQNFFLHQAWDQGDRSDHFPRLKSLSLQSRQVKPGIWVGKQSFVSPRAKLFPPVVIGEKSRVGRDAELGPSVVIADRVVIDEGATLKNTTVLDHSYVGQSVLLEDRLVNGGTVVDIASGKSIQVTDDFLLGQTPQDVSDIGLTRVIETILAAILLIVFSPLIFFTGLFLFLVTGGVFEKVEHIHPVRESISAGGNRNNLMRFSTGFQGDRFNRFTCWLKRWELDRLPELWNVLTGDLRLVGVKPIPETEASNLAEVWELKRNEYHPGFTGLWYLRTGPSSDLDDTLIADAFYVATRTWQNDFRILWQTPGAWWRRVQQQGE